MHCIDKREDIKVINRVQYIGETNDTHEKFTITADSANEVYINPSEVKEAIKKVTDAINTGIENINNKLMNGPKEDVNYSIVVTGTKMDEVIEQATTELSELGSQLVSSFDGLYDAALEYHDKGQKLLNNDAEAKKNNRTDIIWTSSSEIVE